MSILIKGMEMPSNCLICPLSVLNGERLYCEVTKDEVVRAKRAGDCPLVPAVDVAEVRHGRWTHERLASTTGGTYPAIRCSVCETAVPIFDSFPYCPNCGAKMDESEGDDNG